MATTLAETREVIILRMQQPKRLLIGQQRSSELLLQVRSETEAAATLGAATRAVVDSAAAVEERVAVVEAAADVSSSHSGISLRQEPVLLNYLVSHSWISDKYSFKTVLSPLNSLTLRKTRQTETAAASIAPSLVWDWLQKKTRCVFSLKNLAFATLT
jgi:hypothetical protein